MVGERAEEVAVNTCPCCNRSSVRVVDSRIRPNGSRLRRKECWECGHRFSTIEALAQYIDNLEEQDKTLRKFSKEIKDIWDRKTN